MDRCLLAVAALIVTAVCSGDMREGRRRTAATSTAYTYRVHAENNGCTAVRFAYSGKGFSYEDVPSSMIAGESVAIFRVVKKYHP